MILYRLVNVNLSRLLCSILILFSVIIQAETVEYSIKYGNYSGTSSVVKTEMCDSIILLYSTSVSWGLVKISNRCLFSSESLDPVYIHTEFNSLFKKYKGGTLFLDSFALYYQGKDTLISRGQYAVNDWLILPFFLTQYEDSIYSCTLLQGDITMYRQIVSDTVKWISNDNKSEIIIYNKIPIFIKYDNTELRQK